MFLEGPQYWFLQILSDENGGFEATEHFFESPNGSFLKRPFFDFCLINTGGLRIKECLFFFQAIIFFWSRWMILLSSSTSVENQWSIPGNPDALQCNTPPSISDGSVCCRAKFFSFTWRLRFWGFKGDGFTQMTCALTLLFLRHPRI